MPKGVKAFPVNYRDGLTAEEVAEFSGLKNGLHANAAETSANKPAWGARSSRALASK